MRWGGKGVGSVGRRRAKWQLIVKNGLPSETCTGNGACDAFFVSDYRLAGVADAFGFRQNNSQFPTINVYTLWIYPCVHRYTCYSCMQ